MISARFIKDPSPVWDRIKHLMTDQGGELIKEGAFVGAFNGDDLGGAWLVKPWNNICYEIHGGVSPDYWGYSEPFYRTMGEFLFKYTPALKLIAIIPVCNPLVIRMAKKLGMTHEGTVKESFMRKFKVFDQHIYGISRKEVFPCRR